MTRLTKVLTAAAVAIFAATTAPIAAQASEPVPVVEVNGKKFFYKKKFVAPGVAKKKFFKPGVAKKKFFSKNYHGHKGFKSKRFVKKKKFFY